MTDGAEFKRRLSKRELREGIARSGLSCEQFAALLGKTPRTVYAWGSTQAIPDMVALVIFLLDERGGARDFIRMK